MFEILRTGLRSLCRNKIRSFLTIAGIVVGVMSVVVVSAIGEIGKISINNELSGMGMDSLVVSVQSGAAGALTENELEKIRSINSVENAMPLMSIIADGEIKNSPMTCMAWGVNEDADNVIALEVLYGRLLNRGDLAEKNNVCVIDEAIAKENYKRGNVVGKKLTLNFGSMPVELEIVGVVKNGVNTLQNMLGGFIPDFVYVPYPIMQEYLSKSDFDRITVRLKDNSESEEAAEEVKKTLLRGTSGYVYSVDDLVGQKKRMNNILSIAASALSAAAGVSLVVSGISIMTVMLVSVSERTREIGIKKSIGAGKGMIMLEFLLESLVLTLIGSVIGIILGIIVSAAVGVMTNIGLYIDSKLCVTVLTVSLLIGGCFGAYPAYKAASMRPVDALRSE